VIQVMLWLPVAVGLACFALPRRAVPAAAVLGTLVTLVLALALAAGFTSGDPGLQHVVDESWIPALGVRYQLGVDGISLFLLLLTAGLWAAATMFSAFRTPDRRRIYFFMLGLGETAALGAFLAQDLLLFVLFFDLMLVPFWFLIGAFGGENRIAATTKMIVYTLVGSLLMLVAAIATAILASDQSGQLSFSLLDLRGNVLATSSQYWIFCFFAAAFLIKMPAFLVHGWLPDAYKAAPLPVLVLLSGVLSKVGAYGFLRAYALLLAGGLVALSVYFLVVSS
jgi:NADH-quinone oxidoreductase subunit M